jgi:cytochrome c55X
MPGRTRIALAVVLTAVSAIAAAGGAAVEGPVAAVALAAAAAPDAPRARELLRLLKQDCGSCHGMRLTGGLGPALTPEALRTKPAESLVATIVSGRPGTAMPPWRRFVSEAEAQWLVARLLAGATDGLP